MAFDSSCTINSKATKILNGENNDLDPIVRVRLSLSSPKFDANPLYIVIEKSYLYPF